MMSENDELAMFCLVDEELHEVARSRGSAGGRPVMAL